MQVNSIGSTTAANGVSGETAGMDSYSKSIQKQIENIRQQMQELSQNDSLSMEEKMKKKQQMQQQINELNNQLRKHQIEQRRQKQESYASSMDNMMPGQRDNVSDEGQNGISVGQMQSIIAADSSMTLAREGQRTATELKGRAKVMKGEIEADAGRGVNVEKKEQQLQDLEKRAANAAGSQINQLSEAVQDMREAAKSDSEIGEESESSEKGQDAEENAVSDAENTGHQTEFLRRVDVLL